MYKLTIFTPTYNRAPHLYSLYKNIKNQNYPRENFEWLIVDDGSSDNTSEVVQRFIDENIINVRYLKKENGGVHTAWNYGVNESQSEYFFRCDSDDSLEVEALRKIDYHLKRIEGMNLAGICGLCKIKDSNEIVGEKFPQDEIDSTGLEMNFRFKVTGEKAGCYKTEILRQFALPEPTDVNFIYEGTMWRRIDKIYKTRFINEVFKIYTVSGEDSITNQIKKRFNPYYFSSKYYYYTSAVNEIYDYLKLDKKRLYTYIIGISKNGVYSDRLLSKIIPEVKPIYAKVVIIACYPIFKINYAIIKYNIK